MFNEKATAQETRANLVRARDALNAILDSGNLEQLLESTDESGRTWLNQSSQGIVNYLQAARRAAIFNLHELGFSIEKIAEITEFDKSEVTQIIEDRVIAKAERITAQRLRDAVTPEIANLPISKSKLSARARNVLYSEGVHHVGDFTVITEKRLTEMDGMGKGCLGEVKELLQELGVKLRGE